MLIRICAWCQHTMDKDNMPSREVTDMFRAYLKEQGTLITHGCCKACLDQMDKEQDGSISNSMTSDHPSGLYYTGDYDKESEMDDVCKGCPSEDTLMDCAMCPDSHEAKELMKGTLLEKLTRIKVIWDTKTKFDTMGMDS